MRTILNRFRVMARNAAQTISSISLPAALAIVAAVSVGCMVGHESGIVAGILAVPGSLAVLAIPAVPFSINWQAGLIPPELQRMITANAEISAEELGQMFTSLRAEINAMLKGLPPVEQFEAAPGLVYGLNVLRNAAAQMMEMQEALSTAMKRYTQQAETRAETKAEQALVAKGEYVKKTDAQTATDQAVAAKETELKDAAANAEKESGRVEAARGKLVSDKVCTEATANALPGEFFKADGYDDRVKALKTRLSMLASKNLVNEKAQDFVSEMVAVPFNAEGDKTVESRVKTVASLVSSSASRSATRPPVFAGAGGNGDGGEKKTPRVWM